MKKTQWHYLSSLAIGSHLPSYRTPYKRYHLIITIMCSVYAINSRNITRSP